MLVLNFQISENAERWLEFAVGAMLTLLGLNVLRKIVSGGKLHFHTHDHGEQKHVHEHRMSDRQLIAKAMELAKELKIDPKDLLGELAIEGTFEEVKDAEVLPIEEPEDDLADLLQ